VNKKNLILAIAHETEVAVVQGTSDWQRERARRAIVLAVEQDRRVYSGARWDMRGHVAHDGVKVRYLDDEPGNGMTGAAGSEEVVGARNVIGAWADHTEQQARSTAVEQARSTAVDEQRQHAERCALVLGGTVQPHSHTYAPYTTYAYTVNLTVDAAAKLAAMLSNNPA
jgi:hypothetical protein